MPYRRNRGDEGGSQKLYHVTQFTESIECTAIESSEDNAEYM